MNGNPQKDAKQENPRILLICCDLVANSSYYHCQLSLLLQMFFSFEGLPYFLVFHKVTTISDGGLPMAAQGVCTLRERLAFHPVFVAPS